MKQKMPKPLKSEEMEGLPESDCLEGFLPPRQTMPLIGHREQVAQFVGAFQSGKMPHAWLLTGLQGIGKATFAYHAARFILRGGKGGQEGFYNTHHDTVYAQVLGQGIGNLKIFRRGWNSDRKRFFQDISVDGIRSLKTFFQQTAHGEEYRIALIDAVDDLSLSAANALLKILEEPPAKCLLLLVCHQGQSVLPTIRSRCRHLPFSGLLPEEGQRILQTQNRSDISWQGGQEGSSLRLSVMVCDPVWQKFQQTVEDILSGKKSFRYQDIPYESILGLLSAKTGQQASFLQALTLIWDRVIIKALKNTPESHQRIFLLELWEKIMHLCQDSISLQIEPNGVFFSTLYILDKNLKGQFKG
jgi:hypothetical protein